MVTITVIEENGINVQNCPIVIDTSSVGPQGPQGEPGPPGPPGTSSDVAAAAILLTPSLTPAPGDSIWTVIYKPGAAEGEFSGLVPANEDFSKITEYQYSGLWEPDPNDLVLLMLDEGEGGQQDSLPSTYARFTSTGFEPITVPGGTLVSLSCGGAGYGVPAVFVGSNYDTPLEWATWPLGDAEFFQPLNMAAQNVITRTDFTGNLDGAYNAHQAFDLIDALSIGDSASATYYVQTPVTVEPWAQGDADLGAPSGTVDAIVVPTDSIYYVQATINFTATATVTAEATTGDPLFRVSRLFRSLDGAFSGWIWGIGGQEITTPVHGMLGGLPFAGYVHRDGRILDADGNQLFRTIKNGDTFSGTVVGVFNAD